MRFALIQIPNKIRELIEIEKDKLFEAWSARDDGENFNISIGIKFGTDRHGKNLCDISLSFIKEKIKTVTSFTWDDHQIPLFKTAFQTTISPGSISIDGYYPDGKSVTLGMDCKVEKDFKTNTIRKIRLDTGEIVEERAMTTEERNALCIDKEIPCLDCVNSPTMGGTCDRELFHASVDGKEWECEGKIKYEDLPEDQNEFYNKARALLPKPNIRKKKNTKKDGSTDSPS